MTSVCDFLFSADLCVADARAALTALTGGLGVPEPGPQAYVSYPDEGWDVIFALVNKAFAAAPTRLEIIAPLDAPQARAPRIGRKVFDRQAPRQIRSHATVVACPDLPALAERVRRSGAAHWLQEPAEDVPFARLWMGAQPGDLAAYDPAADAGFMFEFIPSNSPAFSPRLFQTPDDAPQAGETGFRRIISRSFVVTDLPATLLRLEEVFGWAPAHPIQEETGRAYRFATMSANVAHGAALRLVQPLPDADPAWGAEPGPSLITIAAYDLDATADDLTRRGVAFRRLPGGRLEPPALLPDLPGLGGPILIVAE